jgi:hypothetical protein
VQFYPTPKLPPAGTLAGVLKDFYSVLNAITGSTRRTLRAGR